jgi:hypothetical protein
VKVSPVELSIDPRVEALKVGMTYLPEISRPLDNTAMTGYKTCPREFMFGMIQHRRGEGRSPALVFGDVWHTIMKVHYRTGGDKNRVINAAINGWKGHDSPDDYRTLERALRDYEDYRNKFGLHECSQTVGFPEEPMIEISTNALGLGLLHPWAGKLDRFYSDGGVFIEDHKTTSRLDKNYFKQYQLSNQMKGYQFLGQLLMPSERVLGVRINLSHVLTKKTEFHRQLFTYSPAIISEWVSNENIWMQRLANDYKLLAEGDPSAFPGHYGDNGCSRKFGMCPYHPVCTQDPTQRQRVLERDYPVNIWNPLEAEHDPE